jgi:hypothetical protein
VLSPALLLGFVYNSDQGQELSGTISFIQVLLDGPLLNELLGSSLEHSTQRPLVFIHSQVLCMDLLYHNTQAIIEESPDSFIIGCPL